MQHQPNIIIFNPDSYRGDVLGHLGNRGAVTPNIDQFVADDAVSYRNAFAQNPVCTPSRCSFMTGLYPHVHGHRSMKHLLRPHERHLFNVLRENGYFTWWGGKNDLLAIDEGLDYDDQCDVRYNAQSSMEGVVYPTVDEDWMDGAFYRGVIDTSACTQTPADNDTTVVNGAVEFIRSAPDNKPFFMFLALGNPHPAYQVEDFYLGDIDVDKLPPRILPPDDLSTLPPVISALHDCLPTRDVTDDQWREVKRIYYGMCTKIDSLFGKIVDALKEQDIYDDTLLIFMSDHGDFTGDYSLPEKTHSTLQDALINVPFVVKPPKGTDVSPGVRDDLIELIDMSATIYDMAGLTPDYDCQGI
ncbi:sulfatase-like hydrolase/transferase, partial [bacterium AH-315-E10]|nr:sulfatase-like hydrolase/transferase [bacterium AH-315-E10]